MRDDGYLVTDDQNRIDVVRVHKWLSEESYWAAGTSMESVSTSVRGSITFACFDPEGVQVGVTRLVTDGATIGVLTDVFVKSNFRNIGLGKFLVRSALDHPQAKTLRRILLCTDDAHDLYRSFGFDTLSSPQRWMELRSL